MSEQLQSRAWDRHPHTGKINENQTPYARAIKLNHGRFVGIITMNAALYMVELA